MRRGHGRQLAARTAGSWSPGLPRTSITALRARVAIVQPAASSSASSAVSSPASRASRSPSSVEVVRSSGTSPACCSCSSCTVHSTSASPPRPSFVCVLRSAPRGSRSASTRALIRRISVTAAPRSARRPGSGSGRPSATNRRPSSSSPATGRARSRACASHDLRPARVVLAVGRRGCARARPERPSGRRSASTTSAGSGLGAAEQRRDRLGDGGRVLHRLVVAGPVDAARTRTARRRRCRSPAPRRRAGPSRSPRAGRAARSCRSPARTASSVACSTATHTELSAAHTCSTSSTPSRSAHAIRSISCRRSDAGRGRGAVRVRLPGDGRAQRRRRPRPGRGPARRPGPAVGAASSRSTSGARTSRSGTSADVPSSRISRSRHQPLVAQQPQVPGRGGERLGHPAVGQQAAVRVGAARRARRAAPAAVSAGSTPPATHPRSARAGGRSAPSGDAQPSAPSRAAAAASEQPRGVGRQPGHRGQQRPVEQLLVQPADPPRVAHATPRRARRRRRGARRDAAAPRGPASAARRCRSGTGSRWVRRSRCSCSRCSSRRRNR